VKYPGWIWQRKRKRPAVKNAFRKSSKKNAVALAPPEIEQLPVTDLSHQSLAPEAVKSMYANKWVAEVEVVHPNGYVLSHYLGKVSLSRKMRLAKQTVKMLKSKNKPVEKAMKKVEKLQLKLEKSEKKLYSDRSKEELEELQTCIGAFVIFNHVESHNRCLDAYRNSTGRIGRKFQHNDLRFKCKKTGALFPLKVVQAPEPSDIQWENLDKGWKELLLRRLVTLAITFLLLVVSIVSILWAQTQKRDFQAKVPDISVCKEIPAVYFGDYEYTEDIFYSSLSFVRIPMLDEKCENLDIEGRPSFYLTYGNLDEPVVHGDKNATTEKFGINAAYYVAPRDIIGSVNITEPLGFGAAEWVVSNTDIWSSKFQEYSTNKGEVPWCRSPCVTPSDETKCRFPCFEQGSEDTLDYCPSTYNSNDELLQPKTYSSIDLVGCYCKDRLQLDIASISLFKILRDGILEPRLDDMTPEEEEMCKEFLEAYASNLGVVVGAATMVAVINTGLKVVLKVLAKFEGHDSLSDEAASVSSNLLIVQFINTALIVYFVNLSYTGDGLGTVADVFKLFGLFDGDYEGFPPGWYTGVGAALILTMLLQIFIPHAGPLLKYLFLQPVLKFVMKRTATTQRDLDKIMIGSPFPMSTRMPEVLNTFFVTLLYCGGIPILLPFAMCNFYISFQLDKLWYLRLYGGTPAYDASIARNAIQLMPIALILHLFFAFLMYGDTNTLAAELFPISHPEFPEDPSDPVQIMAFFNGPNPEDESCGKIDTEEWCGWINEKIKEYPLIGLGPLVWGPMSRVLLYNTLPIFFLLAVVLGLYVAYRLVGYYIVLFIAKIVYLTIKFITCGKYPKSQSKAISLLEARVSPPYTGLFKLLQPNGRPRFQSDDVKAGKFVIVDGGHFYVMRCPPTDVPKGKELKEVIENFGLVTDKNSTFYKHALKTWEQMPMHSYRVYANDKYRVALSEANVPMNVVEETDTNEGAQGETTDDSKEADPVVAE